LGFIAGVIFHAIGVGGLNRSNGNIVGVVVLVMSVPLELFHIVALSGVRDIVHDGVWFSHGDPCEEEVSTAIHRGIASAVCKVEATSKIADIGAATAPFLCGLMKVVMLSKRGKSCREDGLTDGGCTSMPKWKDFDASKMVGSFGALNLKW
jgi:hypothetical protein